MEKPRPDAMPHNWQRLFHFYRSVTRVRLRHIAIPVSLSFLAAGLEGMAMGLLIPLSKGIGSNDFRSVWELPLFGSLLGSFANAEPASPQSQALGALLIVVAIFLLRLVRLGVDYARHLYQQYRDNHFVTNVRRETFRLLMSFGRGFFEQRAVGQIHLLLEWSASPLATLRAFEDFLTHVIRLSIKLAVMLAISVPLTLVIGLAFPFIYFVLRELNLAALRLAEKSATAMMREHREAFEYLATAPLVKVTSSEHEVVSSFGEVLEATRDARIQQDRLRLLSNPVQEGVIILAMLGAVIYLVTPLQDFSGDSLALFCAFFLVAQQSMPNYMGLHRLKLSLLEQAPLMRRIADLLEPNGKGIVQGGDVEFRGLKRGVEVRALTFGYRKGDPVLKRLRADINAGEITAIVGETGAGKSTLVDLLLRFYECHPKMIKLDGTDIRDFDLASLHNRMAFVSQETWLLNRSLRENLCFGLSRAPSEEELLQVLDAVCLTRLLERLPAKLDTEIGDRGVSLSGGERQRLSIARALLREPDILILDEATSALDSATEAKIQETIDRFAHGRTVIVIAHRLSTIRNAHQILVMSDGKIIENGSWEELSAADGEFARLLAAQSTSPTRSGQPVTKAARAHLIASMRCE